METMVDSLDQKISKLIEKNIRKVPFFYDEGVCDVFYVPIEGGELRVFHHKPKKYTTKRPMLFVPGLGTTPWTWRDLSIPFIGQGEFYFFETREKKSSKFKNRLKTKITVEKVADDIAIVIKYLGLDKRDFVLYGTSYCAGVILKGLIDKTFTAPTIALVDPFVKVFYHRKLTAILRITPPFIIGLMRYILGKIALKGEKNTAQKERGLDMINNAVPWKWRKVGAKILKFDIRKDLSKIEEEVLIIHGTEDKHHPHAFYENIANQIPKGRYFFTLSPENKRELLIGIIGYELCKVSSKDGIPSFLKPFEIKRKQ